MRIVVLEETLGTGVKDFNLLIAGTRREASSIRMVGDRSHHTRMVEEAVNDRFSQQVPKSDASVVTARCDHARVHGKLRRANPVGVALERLAEFALMHIPDLNEFIVGGRNEQATILVEIDRLDGCCVATHHRAVCTRVIVPDPDCCVAGY